LFYFLVKNIYFISKRIPLRIKCVQELTRLVMDVSKASQQVEHREGILARLNPLYRRQYVTPAEEHAAELMRQARQYNE
jgi:hypothetical protein